MKSKVVSNLFDKSSEISKEPLPKPKKEERYYIVSRDNLGSRGHMYGYTKEEAIYQIEHWESGEWANEQIVVIKGIEVGVEFKEVTLIE